MVLDSLVVIAVVRANMAGDRFEVRERSGRSNKRGQMQPRVTPAASALTPFSWRSTLLVRFNAVAGPAPENTPHRLHCAGDKN